MLIIFAIGILAVWAALEADMSQEQANKGRLGVKGYAIFIIASVLIALVTYFVPFIGIIIAIAIGVLAMMNREGKHRAHSWVASLLIVAATMLFGIMGSWDRAKLWHPNFHQFQWLLVPFAAIVLALLKGRLMENHAGKSVARWNKKEMKELKKKLEEAES